MASQSLCWTLMGAASTLIVINRQKAWTLISQLAVLPTAIRWRLPNVSLQLRCQIDTSESSTLCEWIFLLNRGKSGKSNTTRRNVKRGGPFWRTASQLATLMWGGEGFELLGLDVSLFIYVTFPSGMEPIEGVWKIGEVKHWRLPDELSACHVQTDQSGLFLLELEASYWCVEQFKPQMTAAVCLIQSFFNILMMRKCSIHANLFSNGHYIQLEVASTSSTTSSSSCSHFSLRCITQLFR